MMLALSHVASEAFLTSVEVAAPLTPLSPSPPEQKLLFILWSFVGAVLLAAKSPQGWHSGGP